MSKLNITKKEYDYFTGIVGMGAENMVVIKPEPLSSIITSNNQGANHKNNGVVIFSQSNKLVKAGDVVVFNPLMPYKRIFIEKLKDQEFEGLYIYCTEEMIAIIEKRKELKEYVKD